MWTSFKRWLKRVFFGDLYVITYYDENDKVVGQGLVRSRHCRNVEDIALFNMMNVKEAITFTVERIDDEF